MAHFETTAWQYLRWPVAFFATNGKDLFFIFIYIQKEILKSGALSRLDVLCQHSCLRLMVVHRKTYILMFLW